MQSNHQTDRKTLEQSNGTGGLRPLPDSGSRQHFATGSQRDRRDGKGRYDLIPPSAIAALARHSEDGGIAYGDRNWEKGQPVSRYFDSAMRHLLQFWSGKVDEMHLHAAFWNIMAMIDTHEKILSGDLPAALDDHPQKGIAPILLRVIRHVKLPDNLDDCWGWGAADNGNGYPVVSHNGKKAYPHRLICEERHGPPPSKDAVAMHSCDNPSCVNPRHLSWGTSSQNNAEARAKKRSHSNLSEAARDFIKQSDISVGDLAQMFSKSEDLIAAIKIHHA